MKDILSAKKEYLEWYFWTLSRVIVYLQTNSECSTKALENALSKRSLDASERALYQLTKESKIRKLFKVSQKPLNETSRSLLETLKTSAVALLFSLRNGHQTYEHLYQADPIATSYDAYDFLVRTAKTLYANGDYDPLVYFIAHIETASAIDFTTWQIDYKSSLASFPAFYSFKNITDIINK